MATPEHVHPRQAWLVFGAEVVRPDLIALLPEVDFRTATAESFAVELLALRPRLVIVAQPPADRDDVEMVALERRRPRSTMRSVLLTLPDDIGGRLAALDEGFDDALPLSIDMRELAARLRRLGAPLRPTTASRSAIPIADGIELDLQAYELRKGGRPERLRPKEFQLLALLATHPRRAYTRQELIERVWGTSFAGDPRTIDVHLSWLRSKVEVDPEHPAHLITVRGRGYRFDPPA